MTRKKEIVLALGGGGTRGIAHLGVMRFLEQEGFQVKAIAGTSAGGAFGSLFAAGIKPDDIITRLKEIDQTKLFGRLPNDGPSLLGLSGVIDILYEFLGDRNFQDLPIPFVVNATDIKSMREVLIRNGRIIDALLATMAFPGIFPPREWDDYLFVDGGVMNNVPVLPARILAPNLPVVAVTLSEPVGGVPVETPLSRFAQIPLLQPFIRLRVTQSFKIFYESLELSLSAMTDLRLQIDRPEVIIRPDLHHISLIDKIDIDDAVRRGEEAAQKNLPDLNKAISFWGKTKRRLYRRKRHLS